MASWNAFSRCFSHNFGSFFSLSCGPFSSFSVKLADFGVAKSLKQVVTAAQQAEEGLVGSPYWMRSVPYDLFPFIVPSHFVIFCFVRLFSPEVIRGRSDFPEKADIWALGITAIELAEGCTL